MDIQTRQKHWSSKIRIEIKKITIENYNMDKNLCNKVEKRVKKNNFDLKNMQLTHKNYEGKTNETKQEKG